MTHVIQNPDINVGPGNYKDLPADVLLVSRVFYTIQGEGPFAGRPAVFVRLAGCNRGRKTDMGCTFCDTAFQFASGEQCTFVALEEGMAMLWHEGCTTSKRPVVVITGGEPMMQNNLAGFCQYLLDRGWKDVQIESNGDRLVKNLPNEVVLVVSPKTSRNSTSLKYEYREPNDAVFDRANYFKFLVEADSASPYHMPPSWADICGRPVYVSPITQYMRAANAGEVASAWNQRLINLPVTRANYAHAAHLAQRYGYWCSMQQHLFFGVP